MAVACVKICRARKSPTSTSSSPTMTIMRVEAAMLDRLGWRVGTISPGIVMITRLGNGKSECGSAATAAICAARLPPAEWPIKANRLRSGADMLFAVGQDSERIAKGREGVRQKVPAER